MIQREKIFVSNQNTTRDENCVFFLLPAPTVMENLRSEFLKDKRSLLGKEESICTEVLS
jgi:hypothetical protein